MTLIYTPRHVDQLISEIKGEWVPDNDPDMHRVADAFPLEVLERAYLRKLDAETSPLTTLRARTASQKLRVMRTIYRAWLRRHHFRLGQLLVTLIEQTGAHGDGLERALYNIEDEILAKTAEEYTAPK